MHAKLVRALIPALSHVTSVQCKIAFQHNTNVLQSVSRFSQQGRSRLSRQGRHVVNGATPLKHAKR